MCQTFYSYSQNGIMMKTVINTMTTNKPPATPIVAIVTSENIFCGSFKVTISKCIKQKLFVYQQKYTNSVVQCYYERGLSNRYSENDISN